MKLDGGLRIVLFVMLTVSIQHNGLYLSAQEKSDRTPEAQKTDKIFDEIFRSSNSQEAPWLHTGEIGQVLDMSLPVGWYTGERRGKIAYSQAFHLKSNTDVMLVFSYRGYRISREAASEFVSMLEMKPGSISLKNFRSLPEIIGPHAREDTFSINSVRIEFMNNRKVLLVEGEYRKNPIRRLTLYVDADRTEPGTVVQEITYIAPAAEFDKHMANIKKSFSSIMWK